MAQFRTERLANGIELEFSDFSNRYYGDYHRVRVEVRMSVPLPTGSDLPVSSVATDRFGLVKYLERMAVPGADVEATRNRLADDYLQHAGRYLSHADYPARLAAAEAAKRSRSRTASSRSDAR